MPCCCSCCDGPEPIEGNFCYFIEKSTCKHLFLSELEDGDPISHFYSEDVLKFANRVCVVVRADSLQQTQEPASSGSQKANEKNDLLELKRTARVVEFTDVSIKWNSFQPIWKHLVQMFGRKNVEIAKGMGATEDLVKEIRKEEEQGVGGELKPAQEQQKEEQKEQEKVEEEIQEKKQEQKEEEEEAQVATTQVETS